jgi:hypothetical protein
MNNIDILLYAVIFYMIYLVANGNKKQKKNKCVLPKEHFKGTVDDPYLDDLIDELKSWEGDCNVEKKVPHPNFLDTKFHNEYRDVITALNNLVPSQKQLFNLANMPIKYSEIDPAEVKCVIDDFITNLNKNIIDEVPNCRNKNSGWDEGMQDPQMESGWDKFNKNLGLNPSLYNEPKGSTQINVFKVDKVQKYESDNEIKYICHLILEKIGVKDQMLLKATFVQDKIYANENNFFVSKDIQMRVAIEELFIVGYLSNYGMDSNKQYEMVKHDFYHIDDMERNNLTDPKYVIDELQKRHNKIQKEMDYRNTLLDEDGQDFHKTMPYPYDYSSYQVTQTIYDDMNHNN